LIAKVIAAAPSSHAPIAAAPSSHAPIAAAPVFQTPISAAPVFQAPISAAHAHASFDKLKYKKSVQKIEEDLKNHRNATRKTEDQLFDRMRGLKRQLENFNDCNFQDRNLRLSFDSMKNVNENLLNKLYY
jgi:hypothetical protein